MAAGDAEKVSGSENMIPVEYRGWNVLAKMMIDLKEVTPLVIEGQLEDGLYIPFTEEIILMQYTGQVDKNGKKDWVGDIVKAKVGKFTHYREIFQSEISGAYCINLPSLGASSGQSAIMLCTIEHENVGNKYDDPGLLE